MVQGMISGVLLAIVFAAAAGAGVLAAVRLYRTARKAQAAPAGAAPVSTPAAAGPLGEAASA